jgi:hypothetical protein
LLSEAFGICPCGFLLSALPTQPAHGSPVATPPPLPLCDADPSRVEQYGPPGHWPFAPPVFASALLIGCGEVNGPESTAPCGAVSTVPVCVELVSLASAERSADPGVAAAAAGVSD